MTLKPLDYSLHELMSFQLRFFLNQCFEVFDIIQKTLIENGENIYFVTDE